VPAPGKVDASLNEFWVENPWNIIAQGHNLSCYERNRAYINFQGKTFLEISHLTGADSDGDGRAVVPADFRNNGQLDLLVRQVGGGPLLLFENRFPPRSYLEVTLRGRQSNKQGVGARVTAEANGQKYVREMFPHNTYRSQAPNRIHFGLADAKVVYRLTIRWPSGKVQELRDVAANRHIVVDEDDHDGSKVMTVIPGRRIEP